MAKHNGALLKGLNTSRKAERYARGVMAAIQSKQLHRGYVEALICAAYFNGHQSGEVYQLHQAYPVYYGPRGGRKKEGKSGGQK